MLVSLKRRREAAAVEDRDRLAAGEYQSRAFAAAPCVTAAASAAEEPALALAASTRPTRLVCCWVRVVDDFTSCTTSSKAVGRAGSKAISLEVSGSVGAGRRRRTRERARAKRGDIGITRRGGRMKESESFIPK